MAEGKKAKRKASRKDPIRVSAFVAPTADIVSSQTILDIVSAQAILDIFQTALPVCDADRQIIQQVKGHLFRRDFAAAFGEQKCLQAYAMRWSPARALAYTDVLTALEAHHKVFGDYKVLGESQRQVRVVCVGGGAAAEVVALSAAVKNLDLPPISVTAVDSADWSSVLSKITSAVVGPPASPPEASPAKSEANARDQHLQSHFQQRDVLELGDDEVRVLLAEVSLVTIMFTMNELFSASRAKATRFLLQLGEALVGTWLLVVDSPGSYSEVLLDATRRYPMHFLMDHILLEQTKSWRKVRTDESRWFRVPSGLKYPLELENTRYQLHLYQRQQDG